MEKENKRSSLVDVKVREEVEVENKWKKRSGNEVGIGEKEEK